MTQPDLFNHPEVWKTVAGFNRYECSSLGRFKRRKTGRILKTRLCPLGYVRVQPKRNGFQECHLAHRLIAATFLPPPSDPKARFVNHINGIRNDNRPENLEWVTTSQNQSHAWSLKRAKIFIPPSTLEASLPLGG